MSKVNKPNKFESKLFADQLVEIEIDGVKETVMDGGKRNYDILNDAFAGIKQIAIIGYKSQGPAHAKNLRESLKSAGLDVKVVVGLRDGSATITDPDVGANQDDFTAENGTLMNVKDAISSSDVVTMLIEDSALVNEGPKYFEYVKPGATVLLAHGFYLGHLESHPELTMRKDINIGMVAPKGMGPSVRRLYEMGSGINCSFAVEQGDQSTVDLVLGYSLGIGAPNTFQTTLGMEWRSDIFGERAILLGGVHGIVEGMYLWKIHEGSSEEEAVLQTVETIVGPISKTISQKGMKGLVDSFDKDQTEEFQKIYNVSYPAMKDVIRKIYRDVSSGREIAEVVDDNKANQPMSDVDGTDMWRVAAKVRENRDKNEIGDIDPAVAAVYVAAMMAQVDVLHGNGHYWSEIVNESIIEAVDSLNPYMEFKGASYMIDNCSITARRGSRKWFSSFQNAILQEIKPTIEGFTEPSDDTDYFSQFENHAVHEAFDVLKKFRPPVDISING